MTAKRQIRGGNLLARAIKEKGAERTIARCVRFCRSATHDPAGTVEGGDEASQREPDVRAGHLADAHARLTRKPTVCLVGPEGFANAVPAMMEAWGERSPVIFVTGSSTLRRRGSGGYKEIDDVAIAAPLTKASIGITDGTRIPEIVDRAWKIATSGYPAPSTSACRSTSCSRRSTRMLNRRSARSSALQAGSPRMARSATLAPLLDLIAKAQRPILIGDMACGGLAASRSSRPQGARLAFRSSTSISPEAARRGA
jgi:acetolactate synthase-1/2/3 large subunit